MKNIFTQQIFRNDIAKLVAESSERSLTWLARLSGVQQSTLSRFCNGDSISVKNVEKLWPYIYGDKRPAKLSDDQSEAA